MADTWFSQIESKVLTYIQYMLKDKLLAPYPNLNCTTKNQNTTPYTSFPTLYIHVLTPLEQAQDLENNEVNSVLATLEFQVFSNKSEATEFSCSTMPPTLPMPSEPWEYPC